MHMADISDYTPEMLEKAKKYLVVWRELEEDGIKEVVPTIEGLADYLGKSVKTMYNWSDKPENEEFLQVMERVMTKQGKGLSNGALDNKLNATIAKLMLGKHGYKDSSEADFTSGGKPIPGILSNVLPSNNSNTEDNKPDEAS